MHLRHRFKLAYATACLSSTLYAEATSAQGGAPNQAEREDVIVVTGTRRADRTAADSPVPVDVLTSQALSSVASGDLIDKLSALAPSFSINRLPLNDGAIFVSAAQLRGLSPDQMLVLVDGKRRARSAYIAVLQQGAQAVNLSQIPQIALDRVEILRDGASAQYGSDAIAGVVNLILNERPGFSGYVQGGAYYKGDGTDAQAAGRLGLKLGDGGILVASGEYRYAGQSDTGSARYKIGDPKLKSGRLFLNGKYPIGSWELYGFGDYGEARGSSDFAYRGPDSNVYARSFFQDNPPFVFPTYSLATRFPNGFVPRFASLDRNISITGGVRGRVFSELKLDLSARYAKDRIRYRVLDSINASLGPASPTDFYAGALAQEEWGANADAVWTPDVGLPAPLNIAFGAEWRSERYIISPGEPDSYRVGAFADLVPGSSSFPGIRPEQAGSFTRRSVAGYVDLAASVTRRLDLSGAVRVERYPVFGAAWTWKASARYGLLDWINLRAAASTGFRAPTPGQENLTNTVQNPDPAFPPPAPQVIISSGIIPSMNPIAIAVGGRPLQAEHSRSYSAGIVFKPARRTTFSIDAYRVTVRDRIGLTQFYRLNAAQKQALIASGYADAATLDQFRFFINGFATRTQGVDVVASSSFPVPSGRLELVGALNYNDTKLASGDSALVTPTLEQYLERHLPKVAATTSATLLLGNFDVLLRGRYYGAFVDAISVFPPALNERASPRAFIDLGAGLTVARHARLSVGVDNLLSTRPRRVTGILSQFGINYPTQRPYGADGGRYYARLSANF